MAQQIVEGAKALGPGLKIYTGKSGVEEFEKVGVNCEAKSPQIITNQNIKAVVARPGWGAVIEAWLSETPLILPKASKGDDPEIILNENLLAHKLKIASVLDGQRNTAEIMEEAGSRVENMKTLLEGMKGKYGTVEGPVYAGRRLADRF